MLASILVLSGGFGLFAALRVMHEPLTHLPRTAGPPPYANASDEFAQPRATVAPFQSRFPSDSRPIVQVAADLQALRLDRGETTAPIEPPPAQKEEIAGTPGDAQSAEPPAGAYPLGPVRPPSAAVTTDTTASAVASIELPTPEATRAIDPTEKIPLPRAAPPPPTAKASPSRPVQKQAIAKQASPKHGVHRRVAAKTRRARRPRSRNSGEAETAAAPPAFPGSPFQDHLFDNRAATTQGVWSTQRAGGNAPMGGPFVSPTKIDPY